MIHGRVNAKREIIWKLVLALEATSHNIQEIVLIHNKVIHIYLKQMYYAYHEVELLIIIIYK